MRKVLYTFTLVFVLILTLSSCGDEEHTHEFSEWAVTKNSICTVDGTEERTCSCGEKETKPINALGHTEVVDNAVAATCTTDGKTEGKHCSVCNETLVAQIAVDALGHTEVVDNAVAATCTTDGKTEGKHCSVCNKTLVAQITVDALGHTEVVDNAVAATCTTDGKTEGKHCSVCNETLVTQTTIPSSHQYSNNYEYDDNYHWYICLICDAENEKVEHTIDDNGVCNKCNHPTTPTPGIWYKISSNGTYAIVVGYEGTAQHVKIANEYEGLPVMQIGTTAFEDTYIKSITIPDGVKSIKSMAFSGCRSLEYVVIPDSVTDIEHYTFSLCYNLKTVIIGNGLLRIPDHMFFYCNSLTNVVIGDNVKTIDQSAFDGCTYLESIVIPQSVTSINQGAFKNCYNLSNVYYTGSAEDWEKIKFEVNNQYLRNATIHYNYIPEE